LYYALQSFPKEVAWQQYAPPAACARQTDVGTNTIHVPFETATGMRFSQFDSVTHLHSQGIHYR
jgi:hypothetical protein